MLFTHQLWVHGEVKYLGSFESTQEARLALQQPSLFSCALKISPVLHIPMNMQLMYGQLLVVLVYH